MAIAGHFSEKESAGEIQVLAKSMVEKRSR